LPARALHAAHGALFEEFGGWERPAAYPRPRESLPQAAEREAASVRAGVGLFDGSPLGKLELFGPDAAAFLDLMYVGTMSTLAVGAARYGALLDENGVVVDDGVVARLAPDRFWVTTTSGGVARVAASFEEWLQCEYLQHRVAVVPVTAQWANVTVTGPRAWALLERAGLPDTLAPQRSRHMSLHDVRHDGAPLRVLRASFTGELGYELYLPPSCCAAMLARLLALGADLGSGLFGIEALMILRIEKGYLHVGADTDGTTLAQDVGLARGIEGKSANFVGRRSLVRAAAVDPQRLQLVGVQPVDRSTRLAVGAQLAHSPPPGRSEGFLTSACWSPALRAPIALARLAGGRARLGERLKAWHLGRAVEVEVVATPFVDPTGERLHG
jgi:sarcosine oxidase subunit alpha